VLGWVVAHIPLETSGMPLAGARQVREIPSKGKEQKRSARMFSSGLLEEGPCVWLLAVEVDARPRGAGGPPVPPPRGPGRSFVPIPGVHTEKWPDHCQANDVSTTIYANTAGAGPVKRIWSAVQGFLLGGCSQAYREDTAENRPKTNLRTSFGARSSRGSG